MNDKFNIKLYFFKNLLRYRLKKSILKIIKFYYKKIFFVNKFYINNMSEQEFSHKKFFKVVLPITYKFHLRLAEIGNSISPDKLDYWSDHSARLPLLAMIDCCWLEVSAFTSYSFQSSYSAVSLDFLLFLSANKDFLFYWQYWIHYSDPLQSYSLKRTSVILRIHHINKIHSPSFSYQNCNSQI